MNLIKVPNSSGRQALKMAFLLAGLLVSLMIDTTVAQTQGEQTTTVERVLGEAGNPAGLSTTGLYDDRVNRKVFNLLDYDLEPNDKDHAGDNSDKLLNVVDEAAQEENSIIIVPGKFYIDLNAGGSDLPIFENKHNITFVGVGAGSGFAAEFDGDNGTNCVAWRGLFELRNCDNWTFKNLTFEMNANNATAECPLLVLSPVWVNGVIGPSDNLQIIDCTFIDCDRILFFNYDNGTMTQLTACASNVRIEGCDFYPEFQKIGVSAVMFYANTEGIDIRNCNYFGDGLGAHFAQSNEGRYARIDNCYIENTYDSAIYWNTGPVTVTNCIIRQAGKDGIKVVDEDGNATIGQTSVISNNMVFGTAHSDISSVAINFQGHDFIVTNNQVQFADMYDDDNPPDNQEGIKSNAQRLIIEGNLINGNDNAGAIGGIGIRLSVHSSHVAIQNNFFTDLDHAILLLGFEDPITPLDDLGADHIVVRHNTLRNLNQSFVFSNKAVPVNEEIIIQQNTVEEFNRIIYITNGKFGRTVSESNWVRNTNYYNDLYNFNTEDMGDDLLLHDNHVFDRSEKPEFKKFKASELAVNGDSNPTGFDYITKIQKINNGASLEITMKSGEVFEIDKTN